MRTQLTVSGNPFNRSFPDALHISTEEADVINVEAHDALTSSQDGLNDIYRIRDVSDALEDLAVLASQIDNASPTDSALFNVAGQMAAAGSDVEPSKIVPALESFSGPQVAMESIGSMASALFIKILKLLESVWQHFDAFWNSLMVIPDLNARITMLEDKITNLGQQRGKLTVLIPLTTTGLGYNGKIIANYTELNEGLDNLKEAIEFVYGPYHKTMLSRAEAITSVINNFDAENPESSARQLLSKLKEINTLALPGHGNRAPTRDRDFQAAPGKPLLGNSHLSINYAIESANGSVLTELEKQRKPLVTVEKVSTENLHNYQFPILKISEMESLLEKCSEILKLIYAKNSSSQINEMKAARKAMADASGKAAKALEKKEGIGKAAAPGSEYYRALINFNADFAQWIREPELHLIYHTIHTIRAVLPFINNNTGSYSDRA